MEEKKIFNVNWFKPEDRNGNAKIGDKEHRELDWWCRHYKGGVSYLTWRLMQYFEAKDEGDDESVKQLEQIIRACLPYYWEEVDDS